MVSRRKLLALGAVSAVAALFGIYKWNFGDPKDIIVAILKRRVGYLGVDAASFDVFAVDYLKHRKQYIRDLTRLSAFSLPFRFFSPYSWSDKENAFRRLEDNIVSQYLLSTDFFQNGADENRAVKYILFYDPYVTVCRNPFNRKT